MLRYPIQPAARLRIPRRCGHHQDQHAEDHEQQRPILPSIVVRKRERTPSVGFYRLLALVHHTSGEEDLAAWEIERDRVWAFDWPD